MIVKNLPINPVLNFNSKQLQYIVFIFRAIFKKKNQNLKPHKRNMLIKIKLFM